MFGGILSKLLNKGASVAGDDLLARVMTNNGDDIARSLIS